MLFYSSMILFILPFVFIFSLITYYLPEAVFRAWVSFAKWWVPAQILLVFLTLESSGGYFVVLLDKQFAAIVLSSLFTIISLGIVLWSIFTARRT
jgi:hypothetical protein